jgi:hypothetical protein
MQLKLSNVIHEFILVQVIIEAHPKGRKEPKADK